MVNKLIKNILLKARAAQDNLMGLTWGEAQLVVILRLAAMDADCWHLIYHLG